MSTVSEALDCRASDFSLPEHQHYLNCAYMGPLPRAVEEAGIRALRLKTAPSQIGGSDFFTHSGALRERFAALIHAPWAERIAIHPSVSYGVATVARNVTVAATQNIVLLHEQFPGNVYTWRRRASEAGAELRTVMPPPTVKRGEAWTERILEAIDSATAVVTLPTVHWTDGTRLDLEAIGVRAREVGAAFVVDGTQSVGAVDFDVGKVGPDALIVAGYKWMLGPYSMALSYLGERFSDGVPLEETWIGRKGSEDFQGLVDYEDEYQPGAARFDVGERSNIILVPMQVRAIEMLMEWRPERISAYCQDLSAPLIARAQELGFSVEEEAWRSPHLFGLYMPEGLELRALKAALEEREIFVSLRGQALRVAPNVYNDSSDIAALIEALEAARG
jgi:selenocysteine lyase/cysteine desulfurase